MEKAGDLLEDSWFFGNLLDTKPRAITRCYSDLTSTYCPPINTHEHVVKNEQNKSSFSSRKQPVAPPSLTRTPSLPTFMMENPNPNPNMIPSVVQSDQEDMIKNERKSSSFSSRKKLPVASSSPNITETQSFPIKDPKPNPNSTQTSSMSTSVEESDQEDEEDQESEFTLGRLIRQASMNSSHTSSPSKPTSKAVTENIQKKPELDQEKTSDIRKMERNKSKSTKSNGKNKNFGAPKIPRGFVDRSSSADMKTIIKFWARAVATNVRQECS